MNEDEDVEEIKNHNRHGRVITRICLEVIANKSYRQMLQNFANKVSHANPAGKIPLRNTRLDVPISNGPAQPGIFYLAANYSRRNHTTYLSAGRCPSAWEEHGEGERIL